MMYEKNENVNKYVLKMFREKYFNRKKGTKQKF